MLQLGNKANTIKQRTGLNAYLVHSVTAVMPLLQYMFVANVKPLLKVWYDNENVNNHIIPVVLWSVM